MAVCAIYGWASAASAQETATEPAGSVPRALITEYETAPSTFVSGTAEVWDVAASADGQLLASSGADGKVRLYDRASRELLRLVPCHTDSISSLAFSRDSAWLATASYDQVVKIWQLPEMKLRQTFKGHTSHIVCVTLSNDGKQAASCGYDGTIRLWNVTTGEAIAKADGNQATVRSVSFSPDGKQLVSGGDDGSVKLWNAQTLQLLATLEGHTDRVRAVAFSPQGNLVASAGEDGTTRVWDQRDGQALHVMSHSVQAWRLTFSSGGTTLATGYRNGSIRLFEVATGRVLADQHDHSDAVSGLVFLADDQAYYSASYDGSVLAWSARLPARPTVLRVPTEKKVWTTAVSSQGTWFAAAGRDGFVQLRDLSSGRVVHAFEGHPATVDRVEFSRDECLLATASWRSPEVLVWQTGDGVQTQAFEAPSNVRSLAFSPDRRHLAAACQGKQLIVWDLDTGKQTSMVTAHRLPVYDVAYSPDGDSLITCSGDWTMPLPGSIKLWKAASLTEIAKLDGHVAAVRSAVFRPDGDQLASASENGVVKLWDVATQLEVASLQNSAGVRAVAYSADGKFIAAALQDGTINLWDLDQEAVVSRLRGDDDMFSVHFTPDDAVVCGAGGKKRFLFWDVSNLKPGSSAKWLGDWPSHDEQESAR